MTIESEYPGTRILETMKEAVNYNHFLLKRIIYAAPTIYSNQPILDFGAGMGTFAELLSKSGFNVHCIEYDDNLRSYLRERLGYTAHKTLNDIDSRSMNYIYSLNTLEHIENDEETLKDLHQMLDKNGLLYLYVPAFNVLYSSMDKKVGHFRRYRYRELKKKLEKAGFAIKSWQYVDSLGFFVSLLYRWFGDESGEVSLITLRCYDRILFPVSRIFDKGLKKLVGKNLEIIARKAD